MRTHPRAGCFPAIVDWEEVVSLFTHGGREGAFACRRWSKRKEKRWCLAPFGEDTTFVGCSRLGGRELPLDGNLLHAALVATALEAGREESVEDGGCRLVVDETTRQNDDVGVIVLAG